jgi:hypothetical protein
MLDNVLPSLIALHIGANVFYRVWKNDRLIEAMVTGSKPATDYADQAHLAAPAIERPLLRAVACLVVAAAIFAGSIKLLGGKLFYV